MSSFAISKREYIKAAGYFAGLADQENYYYKESAIFWYNSKKGGLMDAEDYYKAFCSLYEMNGRSVMLQYHHSSAESDPEEYRQDFTEYRRKAADLYKNAVTVAGYTELRDSIFEFLNFCNSVAYQIEDSGLSRQAKRFMYTCQHYLLKVLCDVSCYHPDCWGDFNLDKNEDLD